MDVRGVENFIFQKASFFRTRCGVYLEFGICILEFDQRAKRESDLRFWDEKIVS